MGDIANCEREITGLHAFFVDWYTGAIPREDFERLERALDPTFELVHPDGSIADRESILDGIEDRYDVYDDGDFDIEIRNIEPVSQVGDRLLMRYEEWQDGPNGSNGRLSTGLFRPINHQDPAATAPSAHWVHLQETWLESP